MEPLPFNLEHLNAVEQSIGLDICIPRRIRIFRRYPTMWKSSLS